MNELKMVNEAIQMISVVLYNLSNMYVWILDVCRWWVLMKHQREVTVPLISKCIILHEERVFSFLFYMHDLIRRESVYDNFAKWIKICILIFVIYDYATSKHFSKLLSF